MPNTPVSFRLPVNIHGKADPDVVEAINYHDDAITDLQNAIGPLKSQISALATSTATGSGSSTTNIAQTSETVIVGSSTIGMVNKQTGTTYTTQQADYGSFIQFSNAAAIAVTLSTGTTIQIPWFCWIQSFSSGAITLTPATGTINGGASFSVPANAAAVVVYDGTNFEATLVPVPVSGLSVTIATAKLTLGGANGSQTFTNGILTAQTAAT